MITVIGSLNIDQSILVDHFPKKGETILGNAMHYFYGGKGGNQAIACAKQQGNVNFIGAVGIDAHGEDYCHHLKQHNIETKNIVHLPHAQTGMAIITISESDNHIVVIPGANVAVTIEDVPNLETIIAQSKGLLIQFEMSESFIDASLKLAKKHQVPVILNPAPFKSFPIEWLDYISFLTPNETEYESLLTQNYPLDAYDDKIIMTLGENGASFVKNNKRETIAAPKVQVVDTTGAGDTFNGILAAAYFNGMPIEEAVKRAIYGASFATQSLGAQSGMPTKEELDNWMEKNNGIS